MRPRPPCTHGKKRSVVPAAARCNRRLAPIFTRTARVAHHVLHAARPLTPVPHAASTRAVKMEEKFDDKLGHAKGKLCFMQPKLACQVVSVVIVLDALFKFMGTMSRWGAPCYHWWNYAATIITFATGHLARLIGMPIGIYCLLSIRKGEDKGVQILFHYLLGLSFVLAMDLFVCLFEVHDVCNGPELRGYMHCGHVWGKQAAACRAVDDTNRATVASCAAADATMSYTEQGGGPGNPLTTSGAAADKAKCEGVTGCGYVKTVAADWVKPDCCADAMWEGMKIAPCNRDPHLIADTFDTASCERMSDLYDVGLGLVWTAIVVGMAYAVHSFREQQKSAVAVEMD